MDLFNYIDDWGTFCSSLIIPTSNGLTNRNLSFRETFVRTAPLPRARARIRTKSAAVSVSQCELTELCASAHRRSSGASTDLC